MNDRPKRIDRPLSRDLHILDHDRLCDLQAGDGMDGMASVSEPGEHGEPGQRGEPGGGIGGTGGAGGQGGKGDPTGAGGVGGEGGMGGRGSDSGSGERRGCWDRFNRHPFLTTLVLVAAVAVPGYFQVESIAHDARGLAQQNRQTLEAIQVNRVESCLRGRIDTRDAIVGVVRVLSDDPTAADRAMTYLEDALPDSFCRQSINGEVP
jgi:hypothetical protein